MPETFNLGLDKPTYGASGWGDTLNANFDALDAAFAGGKGSRRRQVITKARRDAANRADFLTKTTFKTANAAAGGTAFASSVYSASYPASNAFDGAAVLDYYNTVQWAGAPLGPDVHLRGEHIGYEWGPDNQKHIGRVRLLQTAWQNDQYAVSSVKVQRRTDATTWEDVAIVSVVPGDNWFNLPFNGPAEAIRLVANSPVNGGTEWEVYEVELYEFADETVAPLKVRLEASPEDPMWVSFAAGSEGGQALDFAAALEAPHVWELAPDDRYFFYVDRDAAGTVSMGSCPKAPIYAKEAPVFDMDVTGLEGGKSFSNAAGASEFPHPKAFDGNITRTTSSAASFWHAYSGTDGVTHIGYDLGPGNAYSITKVRYHSRPDYPQQYCPVQHFQYSDDGTNWTTVATLQVAYSSTWQEFAIPEVGEHRYWRLLAGANCGEWAIMELEFWTEQVPMGQHWFDKSEFVMKVWNGTWEPKQRVFVGEALTDATSVVQALSYAIMARYESSVLDVASQTFYSYYHNMGVVPEEVRVLVRANDTMPCWRKLEFATWVSGSVLQYGGNTDVSRTKVAFGFGQYVGAAGDAGYEGFGLPNLSFPTTGSTTGQVKIVLDRGW